MDKTKKWRKILAMMLTIVMMLQNVQSVVWATGTDSSTQETTVEKKSDSEDDKTTTDEEQTKEEISEKSSSEELTDSEEKDTEETAAVLTSTASQSVTADTVGDVTSYYANYRLDVTNTGNAAAEGVKVEITLPVKDAAVDTSKTYTTGYTENVTDSGYRVLTWDNQSVAASGTGTYMFSIQIPAGVTNLSDVNVVWYVNGSKAEAEEWVAGSDETLAANVKADDSTGSNTDSNNSGENSDNNAGNDTSDNNQNTDNGNGGNNNGNSDSANDADRIPDNQASQILTYEGNGVNAKLLLVSENASFPDGFSFQVNPVSAEQTKAYVQNAQNLGLNVNTGAFYDVQLLYNGVNASLTSAESMQLQVNFDSPVLTDVKNVTGVGVTNGNVSTDGVSGNTTSLTKTLTAESVGMVGVVALADDGDQDNKQPVEGDETTGGNDVTTPAFVPSYTAQVGDDATITVNGENLPAGMTFTATDSGEISEDAKIALKIGDKTVWFSKQYSVSLTGGGTPGDTHISISILDTKVGTASVGKEKTAKYLCYYIPENGTAADVQATITKASDNIYVTGIQYPKQNIVNGTYGIVAYRRESETIQLGENQITGATLQYREDTNAAWKDIPTDTPIPTESEIKVKVNYSLGNKAMVVGDTLEYELPAGLTVGTNQTGDITNDANEIIGQYTVGTDKVTLTFYNDNKNGHKSFFDEDGVAQDVKGSFYFSGKLSNVSTGEGSEKKTITIGNIQITIPVQKIPQEDKNSISISKSVVDNLGQGNTDTSATKEEVTKFGDKLIYTLTITAGSANTKYLTGIKITDAFNNQGVINKGFVKGISSTWDGMVAGNSVVATANGWNAASGTRKVYWKYKASGQSIPDAEGIPGISGLEYTLNSNQKFFESLTPTKGTTQGENGATVTVPAVMAPGDKLIIKYAVDIDPNIIMHDTNDKDINNVKYTLGNSASVETDGGYSASAHAEYVYDKTWLDKRATEINYDTIKYTITANKKPSVALKDWIFKDMLGADEGQQYQDIKVEWFDATDTSFTNRLGYAEGNRDNASGSFSGGFTVTDNGGTSGQPSFEWTVPSDHTEPYIYRFTYTVKLTKPDHGGDYLQQFHNTIQLKSPDGSHKFETPTTGGGSSPDISYSRFALTKTQEGVDIANNTISWKTEITKGNTSDYDGTIPAGSVYTDEIPGNVGLHYMTPQQIQEIEVWGTKTGSTSSQKLKGCTDPGTSQDADYQIISDEYKNSAGDTYRGFKIKFLTGNVKTPVTIRYKTTANFSGTVSLDFNNKATFEVNGDEWKSETGYVYSFSNLLSKQPGNYNKADKTLTWNLKVNNSGAVSLPAGIKITDIIPSGLEFVEAESTNSGINIEVDATNKGMPVITVKNELQRQELIIKITTRVTDKLDTNESKTYTNQALFSIGGKDYGTAQSSYTVGYKVLEKTDQFQKYGFVDYTLKINEAKETLIPAIHQTSANPLYIVDHMGDNMMLDSDSVKVTVDGAEYTAYKISQGTSTQDFVISNLPDEKFIQITYRVSLTDPAGVTYVTNSAELCYDSVRITSDTSGRQVMIEESGGSASSGANVYIQKYSKNYEKLAGAEFELGEAVSDRNGGYTTGKAIQKGVTQNKDGRVHFEKLTYDTIYYVKETKAPEGYRLDDTPYIFMIATKGNAVPNGVNAIRSGGAITLFNEKYNAETSTTLVAEKSTVNGAFESGQFSFKIEAQKDSNNNEAPLQNEAGQQVSSRTVANDGNGRIVLGPIKFTYNDLGGQTEKTFKYKISEVIPDGATDGTNANQKIYNGIIYDATPYWVTITVKDNQDRTLTVTETKVSSNEDMTGAAEYSDKSIHFRNTYSSETALKFTAKKALAGKNLQKDQFSFKMTGDGITSDEVVRNDADGNIEFPLITITNKDFGTETTLERTYTFKEENAGQTRDGIYYSADVYTATVKASYDKSTGTISVTSVEVSKNNGTAETVTGENGVYSLSGNNTTFNNIYDANGSLLVKGTKKLENATLEENAYSFILEPKTKSAPIRVKENSSDVEKTSLTTSNAADESFQFPAMYYKLADLNGKDRAVFEYTIKEVLPNGVTADSPTKDGITYDTGVRTLTVTVENAHNGVLNISARINDAEYPTTGDANLLTFTNSYNTAGDITFSGTKTLNGHTLDQKMFAFELYDMTSDPINGTLLDTAFNKADGTYTFKPVKYTLNDVKDKTGADFIRTYLIKERNDKKDGYTYDKTEYEVTVQLADAGNGQITTTVTSIKKSGTEVSQDSSTNLNNYSFDLINTYEAKATFTPTATKRVLPATRKQELESGSFKFNLEGIKLEANKEFPGTAQALEDLTLKEIQKEVANQKDGSVTFNGITYTKGTVKDKDGNDTVVDETGKYVYKLTEIDGKLDGYMYAQKPVYIYVEVTDNHNGTLNKTVTYHTIDTTKDADTGKESSVIGNVNEAVFTNTYTGDGTLILSAVKSLTGRKAQEGQFEFRLEVSDSLNGTYKPVIKDGKEIIASNAEDGTITFPELVFKHASGDKDIYDIGTYYFRISEVRKAQDPAGYTYSGESYIVKVTVEDAETGSGKLKTTVRTIDGTGEREYSPDTLVFHNTYKASGSITLKGTKTLSGSPLVKDQFTFELLDQDQKTVLQTVKNTADGNFAFQPLTYDQLLTAATGSAEKTYYVRETVTAAEKADGITYDSTLYKVIVTIKDKGDGTLSTSSKIQTVSGTTTKDATAIKFANTFAGTASITKTAEDGKTPLPGAEFELYAAKANGSGYTLYGKYPSDSNGKISVSGLPANSYYFVESKAPDGYLIPKDANGNPVKYSFVIGVNAGAGKVANAVADFSQTVVNGKGYGTVELTKYNTAETKTLAGAQFALYDSNGKQVAVRRNEDGNYTCSLTASENTETTLVTGKDGKITITGLMWGSYYFQETIAPDGYVLSNDKISFKVDASSFDAKGNPVTIKTKAVNKATSITIEKVDENGNALAGASMAIRDPQTRQIIESWTSTSEPHVIEGVLTAGKTYYLSEQQAPEGYEIAAEQEFTIPADGKVTVTMTDKKSDGKEGSVTVTKKISLVDEDANVVEAFAKDYTTYIGIFTDSAGEHPYGGDYLQTVQIHNGSSGSVSFTGLPKGTYYIFETDANGTPIAYDDFQTGDIGSFICTVEDGDATVNVKNKSDNSVTLNNVYYDFPDGFAYNGTINITKNVIKDGESADVDDTFYAGIFTKDANGTYVLLNGMVYELLQNDTITVDVPLGGEDGSEPVTYYVMETDETGTPIDKDVFAYEVSGEGTVSLDKDNLEGAITIVNTVDEEEQITPTPTPSTPSGNTTTTTSGGTTAQVHESDSKRVIGVKTGDNTPIGAYAAVLVIAALAIAGGIYYKKKRKNSK